MQVLDFGKRGAGTTLYVLLEIGWQRSLSLGVTAHLSKWSACMTVALDSICAEWLNGMAWNSAALWSMSDLLKQQ
jgi:hypothetical protein